MSDATATRQKLLERLFVAFNDHDSAAVAACMTQDVVFHAAAGPIFTENALRVPRKCALHSSAPGPTCRT